MTARVESRFTTSADGLRLHFLDILARDVAARDVAARDGAAGEAGRTPLICLPGLGRTADDFVPLAEALARTSATPRRIVAVDYRGRGLSDHDPDWRHYDLATERADFMRVLAELGIARAHILGTSRGGLHIMALAADHRGLIRSAILNDIGPVLEPAGLGRIKGYLGRPVAPRSFAEAIAVLKIGGGRDFDGLALNEWRHFAETTFGRDEASLGLRYDPQLARTLDAFDLTQPLPDSWPLFDALRDLPVLTIRGANSDLLSPATLAAMGARWPASETMVVPGQGHAPLLADEVTIARIDGFLAKADA